MTVTAPILKDAIFLIASNTEELEETAYIDRIFLRIDDNGIIELSSVTNADIKLLTKSDNKYLIMKQGAEHILEFDAPESFSKIEFVAEGYYIKHQKNPTIADFDIFNSEVNK